MIDISEACTSSVDPVRSGAMTLEVEVIPGWGLGTLDAVMANNRLTTTIVIDCSMGMYHENYSTNTCRTTHPY